MPPRRRRKGEGGEAPWPVCADQIQTKTKRLKEQLPGRLRSSGQDPGGGASGSSGGCEDSGSCAPEGEGGEPRGGRGPEEGRTHRLRPRRAELSCPGWSRPWPAAARKAGGGADYAAAGARHGPNYRGHVVFPPLPGLPGLRHPLRHAEAGGDSAEPQLPRGRHPAPGLPGATPRGRRPPRSKPVSPARALAPAPPLPGRPVRLRPHTPARSGAQPDLARFWEVEPAAIWRRRMQCDCCCCEYPMPPNVLITGGYFNLGFPSPPPVLPPPPPAPEIKPRGPRSRGFPPGPPARTRGSCVHVLFRVEQGQPGPKLRPLGNNVL